MKFIRRLLALFTGVILALSVWAYVVTPTLFNAKYAETVAGSTGTYSSIALEVPALLSQVVSLDMGQKKILSTYVDPALIQGWAHQILPELERYYRTGGAVPQLELTTLSSRLNAASIPLPAGITATLQRPVMISAGRLDPAISQVVLWSERLKLWGPITAILLLVVGIVLSREKKFHWLSQTFVWTVLFLLLIWVLLRSAPQLVAATVANSAAGSLSMVLKTWMQALVVTPMQELFNGAIGFGIVAIVSFIIGLIAAATHRRSKHRS